MIAGKRSDFPTLYGTNRSLVSGIVTGGFGFYGDVNPWFGQPALFTRGSPIASRRPGPRIGWTEGFVEYGIGGATQVGDLPIYVFGALTGLTSWSLGQDIYRNEPRAYTAVEKAYAGFIYASPHSRSLLTVSLGRQNVTVADRMVYDANVGDHHHFLVEADGTIPDVPDGTFALSGMPEAPPGYRILGVDVVVRLAPAEPAGTPGR